MSPLLFFKKTLSFDYRSLAFYRFLLGIIVMADVAYRWPDLTNFYTDVGLVPRSIFTSEMTMPWSFSLHLANGSLPFIVVIFAIHFLCGLMIALGYKTRWAVFGAYILTVSVHNRNWLINNGGDDVLRAILFLSVFLPLNKCFSVDSAMENGKQDSRESTFSTWGLAFYLQAFVIYFVGYILKDSPIWRSEFTAVTYALGLDIFQTPLGLWTRGYPFLQKLITIGTIYMEWLGPLVLVFGAVVGRKYWWIVRTVLVFAFWGFHFGIFLTMTIGLFPFIAMVLWSIFLPGEFWDKLLGIFRRKNFGKFSIYYDGDCRFCQKGVRIIKAIFLLPEVSVARAQDYPELYSHMLKHNSWVVVNEEGKRFYHFDAFTELLRHSPLLSWTAGAAAHLQVSKLGNRLYHWVSNNRSTMGKATQFIEYTNRKKEVTFLMWGREIAGAMVFLTIFTWNLTTIKGLRFKAPFFQTIGRWVHLYQEWNMFSPFPKRDNIWVEIPGFLSNGKHIDLLTGIKDIYSIKDEAFYQSVPNEHWRKFYLNLSDRTDYARYYGGFLCRKWNDRNIKLVPGTSLRKLEIVIYSQPNLAGGGKGGISRKLSWKHWCYKTDMEMDRKSKDE
ncbi:MAG TPA: DCC1-like thiol-disulfide oxidoreductase family protein [Bacteriovoracaceae bacterium]|nr:DCC1-like thiol-disulfide oxidoreductase family protein [Bacteriovoracaceae bacterium]